MALFGGGSAGAQIGAAFIRVRPKTDGFGKELAGAVRRSEPLVTRAAGAVGSSLVGAVRKAVVGGVAAVGAAAGAGLGVALTKGFGRLQALEEADKRMRAMGLTVSDTDKLMAALNDTLTGTPYALSDGATAMAGFVAAGVGLDDIPKVMRQVTDAAAFGQAPLNEVADIFQKVALNGKASTEMLNQLQYRGIPASALLADALGKTGEEFREFVSEGKLTAEVFFEAWEKGAQGFGENNIKMAGAAQKAGETVRGAWGNLMTALARVGAAILGPIYERLPDWIGAATGKVNDLTKAITPMIEEWMKSGRVRDALDSVQGAIEGIDVAALVDKVAGFGERAIGLFERVRDAISDALGNEALREYGGESFDRLRGVFEQLADAAVEVWPAVQQIAVSVGKASATVGVSTWELFLSVLEVVAVLADTVLVPALKSLAEWMEKNQGAVTALVAAFTTWRIARMGAEIGRSVKALGTLRKSIVGVGRGLKAGASMVRGFFQAGGGLDGLRLRFMMVGDAARAAGSRVAAGARSAAEWGRGAARKGVDTFRAALSRVGSAAAAAGKGVAAGAKSLAVWTKAALASAAATARDTAAKVANAARTAATTVATKAASVAQAAFNAVMSANPIFLIVAALAALGAAVVLAYKKIEPFRNVVDAIGRFFRDTLWPILHQVGEWIGSVFSAVWERLASVFSDVLWPALKAVIGWVTDTLWPALQQVGGWIGTAFTAYVDTVTAVWGTLWEALKSVIGWVTGTLWPALQVVGGFIGGAFSGAVKTLAGFWTDTLWPALRKVASFITDTVVPTVQEIIDKFAAVARGVGEKVGDIVGFVTGIPGRISRTVSTLWDGLRDGIASARDWVRDRINDIVGFITGIGDRIGDVASAIRSPFETAFNAIKDVWNRTIGGFGFTIPGWVPKLSGKEFRIPTMHTGGVVPGALGAEVPFLLEAGETVRTREQERRLQQIIDGLARGRLGAGGLTVQGNLVLSGGPEVVDELDWWARYRMRAG